MTVYVATKNAGKFAELQAIFATFGWELARYEAYVDVAEGDASYAENAALKARTLHAQLRERGLAAAVLGDDSGLEVAALGGRPGVLSARYGPPGAGWAERRSALLAEVAATGGTDRRARFVCALHYIAPNDDTVAVEATLEGSLAECERGVAGFSYDPIFLYAPTGATFGEMAETEKNLVSHRALAVRALGERLGLGAPEIPASGGNNMAAGT